MQGTISQHLEGLAGESQRKAVRVPLEAIGARLASAATVSAVLAISDTGTGITAMNTEIFYGVADGVHVTLADETDMPALTGIDITAGSFRIVCFFIDKASTVTAVAGVEGTTLALARFPEFPLGQALVGYAIITYASAFTGGSTSLSTATTIYVSPVGCFDPSIKI